jgi:predicted ABC-type transport system involved in lysophospholipase L1 biosynthesis ATPase subunit
VSTRADRGNGAAARPLLVVDGIETFYGSIQALKGVSFEVPEGSIVTLLGANGAGKSTTLKSISGLVPPARGTVAFTGQRIDGLASEKIVRLGISHVPEGRELFPELTVLENLKMGAYTRADRRAIERGLERVESHFRPASGPARRLRPPRQRLGPSPTALAWSSSVAICSAPHSPRTASASAPTGAFSSNSRPSGAMARLTSSSSPSNAWRSWRPSFPGPR